MNNFRRQDFRDARAVANKYLRNEYPEHQDLGLCFYGKAVMLETITKNPETAFFKSYQMIYDYRESDDCPVKFRQGLRVANKSGRCEERIEFVKGFVKWCSDNIKRLENERA